MASDPPNGKPGDRAAEDGESYPDGINIRERFVLYCLSQHGAMALWDLADEMAVWETNTRLPDLPANQCRKVYLSLYHTHVPRLERSGLVTYHDDRDLVALSDQSFGLACRKPPRPGGGVTVPYDS